MKNSIEKIKWIFLQSKPCLLLLTISIIMGSILSAVSVYSAMIFKSLIDCATSGNINLVMKWLVLMVFIILFNIFFGALRSFLTTYCSTKVSNELQRKIFNHVTHADYMELNNHHSVAILTRINNDTATVNTFICKIFPSMITSSVMLILAFFALLKIEPFLAVFTTVVFPLLFIINKLLGKKTKKFYKELQEKNIEYSSFIQESVQNLMIVKTFCSEEHTINKMVKIQKERLNIILKQNLFSSFTGMCFSIGSSGAYFLVFAWGAINLVNKTITFGAMTALLQLFNKIQDPISSLIGCYTPILNTVAAAERLMEFEEMSLENLNPNLELLNHNNISIEFNRVSFSYKKTCSILNKISFSINSGEIIALVGPSGEGKTTIIKLLLSLIHSNEGEIYLGDGSHKETLCKNHRDKISYVPQGNTLFSGTIRENIIYGNKESSFDNIQKACEDACCIDFINNLDDHFETYIGEKGLGISEGQSQRIAIARAFLRKRPILILDEATSALDPDTEIKILNSIKNLKHKPICIIITHRPKALEICDRILRLEDSTIADCTNNFQLA